MYHENLAKLWETFGKDMCTLHNRNYLGSLDYHSKFPVIKKMEDLAADSLILTSKIICSEYGLPRKIMSHTGSNFISDKFKRFCHSMNIEQAVSSTCHHQSNGQVEVCI